MNSLDSNVLPPSTLTIAGSDFGTGTGTGIQADLKTLAALDVHGLSAITALNAQNTRGVSAVHVRPVENLRAQIDVCFADFEIGIDQRTLARRAGVSLPTVQRMESSKGNVRGVVATLTKIVEALDHAGVELISNEQPSQGRGRGVRLKEPA